MTIFRGAVVSLIYAKTLEMRSGGVDESAALTLMSTDIDRLAVSLQNLCEIWARIIEMAIGIWLLERELGWVCVPPIVLAISQDPEKSDRMSTLLTRLFSFYLWCQQSLRYCWFTAESLD